MAHSWCLRHRSQRSGCRTIDRRRFAVAGALEGYSLGLILIGLGRKLAEHSLLKVGLFILVAAVALMLKLDFV